MQVLASTLTTTARASGAHLPPPTRWPRAPRREVTPEARHTCGRPQARRVYALPPRSSQTPGSAGSERHVGPGAGTRRPPGAVVRTGCRRAIRVMLAAPPQPLGFSVTRLQEPIVSYSDSRVSRKTTVCLCCRGGTRRVWSTAQFLAVCRRVRVVVMGLRRPRRGLRLCRRCVLPRRGETLRLRQM